MYPTTHLVLLLTSNSAYGRCNRVIRSLQFAYHTVPSCVESLMSNNRRALCSLSGIISGTKSSAGDKGTLFQHKALCKDSQLGEPIKDCSLLAQQTFLSRQATKTFRKRRKPSNQKVSQANTNKTHQTWPNKTGVLRLCLRPLRCAQHSRLTLPVLLIASLVVSLL